MVYICIQTNIRGGGGKRSVIWTKKLYVYWASLYLGNPTLDQLTESDLKQISRFKDFYRNLHQTDLSRITDIYDDSVVFRDPVHSLKGVADLHAYMSDLCENLSSCRFEYLDQVVEEGAAFIKWDMHFSHKSLGGDVISVRGISHIQFRDKIYYHEDTYDMGALLYENVPLLGGITRWLKGRLVHK
jgi:ketosteroid isomerase-like protein